LVDSVVKIGGGVLAHPERFDAVLAAVGAAGKAHRLLVVPGGGPFADAVRAVDRRVTLSDDTAHWMAVLAMDQFAHLISARLARGVLVEDADAIATVFNRAVGVVPVLAPYRWLHTADPLPHSWQVTSDSIAAWIAGALGARRLVLVKPPRADGDDLVDRYFDRALPSHVAAVVVRADELEKLEAAIGG
jgi:aspartokinase-like uncharacterized kinase